MPFGIDMMRRWLYILCVSLLFTSCNIDEVFEDKAPQITLDSPMGIYTVKQYGEVLISPDYINDEGATYSWRIGGVEVCTERAFLFNDTAEVGSKYISLTVANEVGSATKQMRVDVVELEIPSLSLAGADEGFMVVKGETIVLKASMRTISLPTEVEWLIGGEVVGKGLSFTFEGATVGRYDLEVRAENADGKARVTTTIDVVEERPFEWSFGCTEFNLTAGRRARLAPETYTLKDNVQYTFALGDEVLWHGAEPIYNFERSELGVYEVVLTATISHSDRVEERQQKFVITVLSNEDRYYRAATTQSSPSWSRVYEYTPAPGQFINDGKVGGFDGSQTTPEKAVEYATKRLSLGSWVSLGGFGGYIVVGFDHSIVNTGGYDLAIAGNQFDGSSEPGIVWVMQDENGDGKPNDTWYELAGSESGKSETKRNYAVTYYRPSDRAMSVQWRDSEGRSGEIEYLKATHDQDYYYPLWIEGKSYTLRGTRLKERNYDSSNEGLYWEQLAYDWGYADNISTTDMVELKGVGYNRFKIANAIDGSGERVHLKYIDFVKVQTACNANSGWLGENSAEVMDFVDYSMQSGQE